jgi:hypothetical protein
VLCMPETLSVSCDLRIFVDETAGQIAPAGSERVKASDGGGHRLDWRGLAPVTVRPRGAPGETASRVTLIPAKVIARFRSA